MGAYGAINSGARIVSGNEWYLVIVEDDTEGYLMGKYLDPAPVGNPPSPKFEVGDRVKVVIDDLNIRRRPGLAQHGRIHLRARHYRAGERRLCRRHRDGAGSASPDDNATGWAVQEGLALVARAGSPSRKQPDRSAAR